MKQDTSASQAATVIANARTHRDEPHARRRRGLAETSPVGVVVFDAKTGSPVTVGSVD